MTRNISIATEREQVLQLIEIFGMNVKDDTGGTGFIAMDFDGRFGSGDSRFEDEWFIVDAVV
jgi:hypothetical protein